MLKINSEIRAPWGTLPAGANALECILYFKQQLEWYIEHKLANDVYYTRRDIMGYQIVLESDSVNNAEAFLSLKSEMREKGIRRVPNLEVIETLKKTNRWVEKD